jgi:ABC-type multidrug transport system fused ATPase/permease subunit
MKFINGEKFGQIKDAFTTSFKMLKIIWGVDKRLFIGAFIATVVPAIVPFINIYIYKLVIDMVVQVAGGAPFDINQFYILIGLRLLTYFVTEATFRAQDFISKLLWTKVPIYLNQLVIGKLATLDVQYYEDSKFRNLMERAKESVGFRPQNLINGVMFGFQSLVQLSIAFVAIAQLNWFFIILIILVTIPEFISESIQSKFAWGMWDANTGLRKRFDYLHRILVGPREAKEVRIFKLAKSFLNEMRLIQEKFYLDNKKIAVKGFKTSMSLNIFSTFVFMGIEVYVILQALAKKVTVGDISFYTGTVTNFQNGLGGFFKNSKTYKKFVFDQALYAKELHLIKHLLLE